MTVEFVKHEMKFSDLFRRFADMLDDPERVKIASECDEDVQQLMEIVSILKTYAWEKCGGANLLTPDKSCPASDYFKGAEYQSKKI